MTDSSARLDNLTITIPTYNRHAHLKRLLTYYQQAGLPTRFLVLDSSNEETVAANAALIASCGERFRHVVYPSSLPVAAKLFQGLALVETPYCAFCADDDLIFPDALAHALDFLEKHADYVCTDGIYLNFFPSKGEIQFQVEYGSRGIEASHPCARVFQLFQSYESMFYAVFRTHDLRDIFSFVKDIPSLHYQELFQAAGVLLKGKSHRLPEFYAARQHCEAAEPARDKWQTFYWFADDNVEFLSHYLAYRDDLWHFYERFGDEPHMDRQAFNAAMDMAHVTFFSKNCPPKYFYSRLQQYWPADPFREITDRDSIYEDLRCEQQPGKPRWLYDLIRKLENLLADSVLPLARAGYDKANFLPENGVGWGCRLHPDIWWMATVPRFRKAYLEVCKYLGNPDS